MIARRRVLLALGASALAAPYSSLAQVYGAKTPHIDYLSQGSEADRGVFLGAFKEGLREFGSMKKQRVDAFILMVDAYFLNEMQRIVTLANEYKLPGIYGFREYVEAGGLISYGLSYRDYYKGVARYADNVLRGTKPADLPVEQPAKIELVINLRTAKAEGLTIPASVLARADEVIQ